MNSSDIATLAAGRELDCAIAVRVMNWQDIKPWENRSTIIGLPPGHDASLGATEDGYNVVPYFSSTIAAAWLVWEKLTITAKDELCLTGDFAYDFISPAPPTPRQYIPRLVGWVIQTYDADWESWTIVGAGDTAPLAICRAALKLLPPPDPGAAGLKEAPRAGGHALAERIDGRRAGFQETI